MHFEYLILVVNRKGVVVEVHGSEYDDLVKGHVAEVLKYLGENRWEAVGMVSYQDDKLNQRIQYLLKRKLT